VTVSGDLYFSFRDGETWSEPRHLAILNTGASELGPRLSPDGVWLYFASNRSGDDNVEIYKVRFSDVEAFLAR